MSLSFSWDFRFNSFSGSGGYDLTSRVRGLDCNEQLQLNRMASFTLAVNLNNDDGALTPGAGGTYTATDWFSLPAVLSLSVTNGTNTETVRPFYGIVTDFQLEDDGFNSSVTLTMVDVWTVAARSPLGTVAAFAAQTAATYVNLTATGAQFAVQFPKFAAANAYLSFGAVADKLGRLVKGDTAQTGKTFAQLLNEIVLPSQNGWAWPGTITAPSDLYIAALAVVGGMTRTGSSVVNYAFTETDAMTTTSIPFTELRQGWTIDQVINAATVTPIITGAAAQAAADTTSAGLYGSRAVTYTTAACETNAAALAAATELVNRYATSRFVPRTIVTTSPAITANCDNAAYQKVAYLFDIDKGFAQLATVAWTATGGAARTERCCILGRRFTMSTDKTWTLALTVRPWVDNHSWIIGTDTLDTDRVA